MEFNYVRTESPKITAGDYRFEVVSAEGRLSKSGNKMLVIGIKLNTLPVTVYDYNVENDWFNAKMTKFFDSTGIEDGDFNFPTWIGAVGAGRFKLDEDGFLKLAYYLKPEAATHIPAWVGKLPERQTMTEIKKPELVEVEDGDDLPF